MSTRMRGVVRVISNYVRLVSSFVLGLILVRLLLLFGSDAYSLIALLGAGVGIVATVREVIRSSMVPELAGAYHQGDAQQFAQTYNSAIAVSLCVALMTSIGFVALGCLLPLLRIPSELHVAATLFIVAKAAQTFVIVAFAPTFNMYVVTERMIGFNFWLLMDRVADMLAVVIVLLVPNGNDPATMVVLFGILSAAMASCALFASVILIAMEDRRFRPAPRHVTRAAIRSLVRSVGWNSIVSLAMNLYRRLDMIIMNVAFGLFGNLVFGIASQLTFYVRQITMGLVTGVDAVSARLAGENNSSAVKRLMDQSTRWQGVVIFPAVILLILYAESLTHLWVGARLENPEREVPVIGMLVRLLVLGTAARSLSEGWMNVLAGCGHVRKYAPTLLVGALINPVLVLFFLWVFPASARLAAPACAFTILLVTIHIGFLPNVVARHFSTTYWDVVAPLVRPLVATAICLPVLFCGAAFGQAAGQASQRAVFLPLGVFACLYMLACGLIVPTSTERKRLSMFLKSRIATPQGNA